MLGVGHIAKQSRLSLSLSLSENGGRARVTYGKKKGKMGEITVWYSSRFNLAVRGAQIFGPKQNVVLGTTNYFE